MESILLASIYFFLIVGIALVVRAIAVKYYSRFHARSIQRQYIRYEIMIDRIIEGKPYDSYIKANARRDREAMTMILGKKYSEIPLEHRQKVSEIIKSLNFKNLFEDELNSKYAFTKGTAALALAILGAFEDEDKIKSLLSEKDPDLRLAGAKALGKLAIEFNIYGDGARAREALENIVDLLDKPEAVSLKRVSEIILEIGNPCLPLLVETLQTANDNTRAIVADIIGEIKNPAAIPALVELLNDSSIDVRARAIGALANLYAIDFLPQIINQLSDESWVIRAKTAKALGLLGSEKAVMHLRLALSDSHWWVRRNAGYALAKLGTAGINSLVETLYSNDKFAQELSLEILEEIGEIGRWVKELSSKDLNIEKRAAKALWGALRAGGVSPLFTALITAEEVKTAVILTLIWKEFVDYLLEVIYDAEPRKQKNAIETLENFINFGVIDQLMMFKKFNDPKLNMELAELEFMVARINRELKKAGILNSNEMSLGA